ncbi:MAG TPA: nucleoside-triphosphatase, partial [Rectinemataceae bacterium]|nr:nucleoside-triphosphatase [Rectinemataceae bacterium]
MPQDRSLVERVAAGEVRAVARLISLLEDGDPEAAAALRALHRSTGRSHVVGITGPPGSGKSTLTDKLIRILRDSGSKVAVLAVDPSSPFSGGAILGDRLRMQDHGTDPGVFIRSLASRGRLGGLSRATAAAARVLDAAGYDWVIIET